ncbi:MAG: CapA family protein, partial [Bacillota bacterium]|nr:CapA family protein [Bacillota bacterium]
MRKTLRIAAALVTAATVALCFCIPSAARAAGEEATLLFAGDVMMHQTQLDNHRNGNAYDFKADYDYIRAIVSKADIALANFEMTMSGKTPYKGYPRFNAPDTITDALAYAGFDVMATANNHIRDTKDEGFFRTTQLLRDKGFTVIGTKADENQKTYAVIEKNGIKIGFGNFTSHVNAGLSEATKGLINVFSCGRFEQAMLKVKAEIDAMRADGAEFIVMVMHWGAEYQLKNNAWEQKIARRLADYGAD